MSPGQRSLARFRDMDKRRLNLRHAQRSAVKFSSTLPRLFSRYGNFGRATSGHIAFRHENTQTWFRNSKFVDCKADPTPCATRHIDVDPFRTASKSLPEWVLLHCSYPSNVVGRINSIAVGLHPTTDRIVCPVAFSIQNHFCT